MKTHKIRQTKTADWRFLAGLVLVILVVSGAIFNYDVRSWLRLRPRRGR
jgi:hypothetical protein